MAKILYSIRPIEHGLLSNYPDIHIPGTYSPELLNVRAKQHSIKGRPGYGTYDRNLGSTAQIYAVVVFQRITEGAGTRQTLYLTDSDFCVKDTTSGGTWSYATEVGDYDDTIASISGVTVTAKAGTDFVSDGVVAGDKFILDTDMTGEHEPNSDWATISEVAKTTLTLSATYSGTTGTWTGSEKDALVRKVYTVPTNERWSFVALDDAFYFTNGNTAVQKYTTSYAAALDAEYANLVKYCIEYANRLIIADVENAGVRDPYLIRWSKEGNPSDWTDSTAGSQAFLESEDYITGLGKSGSNIIIYKREGLIFGSRTGKATDPFTFPLYRPGIGCIAPYSIVDVMGTQAFLGRDDFYYIETDRATPISKDKARYKFFDVVSPTEAQNTWGFNDTEKSEVHWFANTTSGQLDFVWNYQDDEWSLYSFSSVVKGMGKGAK